VFRPILPLMFAAALLVVSGCSSPAAEGEAEAERDIAAGTLKLKTYGYPFRWIDRYAQLHWERLGVKREVVAGCVVTKNLVENTRGYNQRVKREIASRFGPTALDDISKQAEEEYKRDHP
jgi:hypothetical protein